MESNENTNDDDDVHENVKCTRRLSNSFVTAHSNMNDVSSEGSKACKKIMATKEAEPSSVNGISLKSNLADVSIFSYAGLFVVLLRKCFEDKWHKEFKLKTLQQLEEHLSLSSQVRESMTAILNGEGVEDVDPFISVLLEDPFLDNSGIAVVFDLLTMALKDGLYDARMRVLIKRVAFYLRVKWELVESLELSVVENLSTNQYTMSEEEQKEKASQAKKQKAKRIALIGLATIGGGTLIGLTGGLAAPLVAAGAGAIIGGAGAAALGSVAGVAIIGSLFGVAGAGLTGYKMKKRVGAVKEFEFEPLVHGSQLQVETHSTRQLHITIAVTGWLNNEVKDVRKPWSCLLDSKEQYCLRWETDHLLAFGSAFDYIFNVAMSMAAQEALKYTVLSTLISAIMWPAALVSAASVIDNPWSVCIQRSAATGKQLAEVLLAREQGHRPVTLIGYSLGARVIFYCLEELSKRKGCEGIIEDVVLLGAPVTGSAKYWEPFERVVAGKIVNGYSRGDWLLKFLYRTSSAQINIAGLHSVRWENRRMCNIDLSDLVSGHMDYLVKLEEILNVIGVRTVPTDNSPPSSICPSSHSLDKVSVKTSLSSHASKSLSSIEDDLQSSVTVHENSNDSSRSSGVAESKVIVTPGMRPVAHGNMNVSVRDDPDKVPVKLPRAAAEQGGDSDRVEVVGGAPTAAVSCDNKTTRQIPGSSENTLDEIGRENTNASIRTAAAHVTSVYVTANTEDVATHNKNP